MKKYLFIVIPILLVIAAVFIFIYLKNRDEKGSTNIRTNNPEIEKLVTISQAEISSFVFVTQESDTDHRLNINLSPFLTLNIDEKEIESFKITNFKATNKDNEVILIHPTNLPIDTVSRTFLFTVAETIKQKDIVSSENSIEYNVVSNVTKYNEVANKGSIIPHFGIIIKDVGAVNYKEILDRDGVFDGAKYLEYSGISLDSLDTDIQFDVNIEFTDKSKYTKRFETILKGERFSSEAAPLLPLEFSK